MKVSGLRPKPRQGRCDLCEMIPWTPIGVRFVDYVVMPYGNQEKDIISSK